MSIVGEIGFIRKYRPALYTAHNLVITELLERFRRGDSGLGMGFKTLEVRQCRHGITFAEVESSLKLFGKDDRIILTTSIHNANLKDEVGFPDICKDLIADGYEPENGVLLMFHITRSHEKGSVGFVTTDRRVIKREIVYALTQHEDSALILKT